MRESDGREKTARRSELKGKMPLASCACTDDGIEVQQQQQKCYMCIEGSTCEEHLLTDRFLFALTNGCLLHSALTSARCNCFALDNC